MLAHEHSMVHQFVSSVIVTIATTLALVGWPNINDVTCLLTPSVALQWSQYQETDEPLQGGCRCWKIPHCHHHNQFTHHCLCMVQAWVAKKLLNLTFYEFFVVRFLNI